MLIRINKVTHRVEAQYISQYISNVGEHRHAWGFPGGHPMTVDGAKARLDNGARELADAASGPVPGIGHPHALRLELPPLAGPIQQRQDMWSEHGRSKLVK